MRLREDYYRILQVHYLAEAEVIESAYRRLAKKYHPDVNRSESAPEIMLKINRAYEELKDPVKRRQYNLEWEAKHYKPGGNDDTCTKARGKREKPFSGAESVLDEYFTGIMNNNFELSYGLISSIDRRNITGDDFIKWQAAVSKVFQLKEFSCKPYGIYKDKLLNGCTFSDVVEFNVNAVEYNAVMDMTEKNNFIKKIVLEDGKWRVFVGYEKLQPLIDKFKSLTGLLTAKAVIDELAETHCKIDRVTGVLNRRGIIEKVENEIHRCERYGNVFSLILCEIVFPGKVDTNEKRELLDRTVDLLGKLLQNNLRKLDIVGRWGEKAFLIVLPETRRVSAIKAAQKIQKILRLSRPVYKDKAYHVSVKFKTTEYEHSLKESLDRICSHIDM